MTKTDDIPIFTQDTPELLDYKFDYSHKLSPTGDTIATSVFSAAVGITVASHTHDTTSATVWVSGGTVGEDYEVVNNITTNQGRQLTRRMTIRGVKK